MTRRVGQSGFFVWGHKRYHADDDQLLGELLRSLVQLRFNTLVVAASDTGTTAADDLAIRLEANGENTKRISAGGVESASQLLSLAGDPDSADVPVDDWFGLLVTLAATSHQHDPPRFVVVDRIPSADISFTLFGRMRDDLWEIHYRWAVFITPGELERYATRPADTFLPSVIHIEETAP